MKQLFENNSIEVQALADITDSIRMAICGICWRTYASVELYTANNLCGICGICV